MDTELFMECEEEELEPWQQVDDSVEEDDMDFDSYCEPVEDSLSPPPASEVPPPRPPSSLTSAPAASSSMQKISSSTIPPPPSRIASSSSLLRLPAPSSPAVSAPTLMAQAPPLILTQTGGTFLFPAASATGNTRPILLTTQGFPVVNAGTPLLLNLQPGQTVQPLTVIQSQSLRHLIRPSVGVPVLPQSQAVQTRPAPTQPGSAVTPMQLPTTLAIHTGTTAPVNLQLTQLSSANSLKLGSSPVLSSGSVNGVTTTASFSSAPTPSVVTVPGVTSAQSPEPPRVVMSVEEFYYGTFEGDLSLRKPQALGSKSCSFTCHICSYIAENNLRLMQHMLQHSELIGGGGGGRKCCRFCYRQFSSPVQLKSHQEQVHGPALSTSMCHICEWAFENELAFLNHMKFNHKPGEMPYICQVCSYRSSFYLDVLQHFASFHRDTLFLLCVFCLKVTKNPLSYQQHVLRHQINEAFHCNRCRLQFIFLKDKMQHRLENHHSFRRPAQLQGLPSGSKVTIRTFGKLRPPVTSTGGRLLQSPSSLIQPIHIKTENPKSSSQRCPVQSPTKRPVSHRVHVSRTPCDGNRLVCLECGTDASDFSAHYPTHVHCLLCPYSSCCSRAYAAHMIHHHVPCSKDEALPLHQMPPPCLFLLRCSHCDLAPHTADQMAEHLLANPDHGSATCHTRTYVEEDLQLCHSEEPPSEERRPGLNKDLPHPSWRSACSWTQPQKCSSKPTINTFTHISGPHHYLSKNSDAIDFFNLIFPSALVELITNETNAHTKTCQYLGSCHPDWVPVTTHEVKGFIGLAILMGIHNLPDPSHYWSWSHYENSYTFYRAMSFKRFRQIAANIRMGSFTTDEYRGTKNPSDSLHIFRPMLEMLGGAMWTAYRPNCCLTVDRALLPSLEATCHSKGNPKTQPQVWLLCDSKSGYCHRFSIQLGEKVGEDPGFTVVPELLKGLEDKHHQLYLTNSLTSVPLMQKLLDQGIYASSSFPRSNPVLPKELWEEGHLDKPGDFVQRHFGPLLLTRWKDTKEMGCLSTNAAPGEPDIVWRRSHTNVGGLDPITRPMAFRLLQENMRGVDICKQLLACNPLGGIHQDRHWRSLFWFLVNLSIVNAFILLRESRKENPPAWVQGGLFTQVSFRMRLGNQLAKCAQKYFETMEIAVPRGARTEAADEAGKRSHNMTRLSAVSERCRHCTFKSIRNQRVYGCRACKANLSKRPTSFLEYHGLSAASKGSTKVGIIKHRKSGAVELDGVEHDMDEAMAPVEEPDFSEDEDLDNLHERDEESLSEEQRPGSRPPSAAIDLSRPGTALSNSKELDDVFTDGRLRIVLFALCAGLREASRVFSTELERICLWLRDAHKHLKRPDQEQTPHMEGEHRMVAWVLSMREQQLPITETSLLHQASTLRRKGAFTDCISHVWAVSFMLRHRLGLQSNGSAATLARTLPAELAAKVKSFRAFTQRIIRVHQLSDGAVAAMDELCLFVDLSLVQNQTHRSEALQLTGTVPLLTVSLAVLADGTMLPSLLQVNGPVADRVLPEFILLEAATESPLAEDALAVWMNKVWLQHLSTLPQASKSVLLLDRHREHMADHFLTSVSGSGTLPAVIPAGCSFCLQPLELCLKPVLQRFLLSRWAEFTTAECERLRDTSPGRLQTSVAELLVDWLVEGLAQLHQLPQLWKKAFDLTGLLPSQKRAREEEEEQEQEQEMSEKPEDVQRTLLRSVTGVLLGSEASDADDAHPLELEIYKDPEEEQEGGERQEEVEKQQTAVKPKEMEEDWKEKKLEEGKETQEDTKEVNKERRETRIVTGEEVGDEWKIKSRTEGGAEGP
ncbi:pogo transposable element with ZNF domain isoform X2 [Betta splendens]|uniref:Pogo transposable element with ZNF domain isoform X2 n=1 Tax=Betta splendens TaxID=158456 RepID=A0A8M1H282_BETSP|nr:pogo transposable element with ZNF domain isoform X2 [Betta splendens]